MRGHLYHCGICLIGPTRRASPPPQMGIRLANRLGVHGEIPRPVPAHAETGEVDPVDIDRVALDDLVEESRQDRRVPAIAPLQIERRRDGDEVLGRKRAHVCGDRLGGLVALLGLLDILAPTWGGRDVDGRRRALAFFPAVIAENHLRDAMSEGGVGFVWSPLRLAGTMEEQNQRPGQARIEFVVGWRHRDVVLVAEGSIGRSLVIVMERYVLGLGMWMTGVLC